MRAPNVIVLGIIGGETQPIQPGDVEFIPAFCCRRDTSIQRSGSNLRHGPSGSADRMFVQAHGFCWPATAGRSLTRQARSD
jgi:hypothetical protein